MKASSDEKLCSRVPWPDAVEPTSPSTRPPANCSTRGNGSDTKLMLS